MLLDQRQGPQQKTIFNTGKQLATIKQIRALSADDHMHRHRCPRSPGWVLPVQSPALTGVREPWHDPSLMLQVAPSGLRLSGAETSCPHQALPKLHICDHNKCCCFKSLGFGLVSYAALKNQNRPQMWHTPNSVHSLPPKSALLSMFSTPIPLPCNLKALLYSLSSDNCPPPHIWPTLTQRSLRNPGLPSLVWNTVTPPTFYSTAKWYSKTKLPHICHWFIAHATRSWFLILAHETAHAPLVTASNSSLRVFSRPHKHVSALSWLCTFVHMESSSKFLSHPSFSHHLQSFLLSFHIPGQRPLFWRPRQSCLLPPQSIMQPSQLSLHCTGLVIGSVPLAWPESLRAGIISYLSLNVSFELGNTEFTLCRKIYYSFQNLYLLSTSASHRFLFNFHKYLRY